MYAPSEGCCKFSEHIICTDHKKCAFCGWNPEVQAERRRLLREAEEEAKNDDTE